MKLKQLAGVLTMALAGVAAQAATVTENFDSSSSIFAGGSLISGSDGYLSLVGETVTVTGSFPHLTVTLTPKTSTYTFSSVAANSSISVNFWYSAKGGASKISLDGVDQILSDTGTGFLLNNPGSGGTLGADRYVTLTWEHLSGSTHELTFSTNSLASALKVDEFKATYTPVTAVPEPKTYAMLLAGLGVMGAIARRRKAWQA